MGTLNKIIMSDSNKITITFNETDFDVTYVIYYNSVIVQSVMLNNSDFFYNFNDETICNIEQLILNKLRKNRLSK